MVYATDNLSMHIKPYSTPVLSSKKVRNRPVLLLTSTDFEVCGLWLLLVPGRKKVGVNVTKSLTRLTVQRRSPSVSIVHLLQLTHNQAKYTCAKWVKSWNLLYRIDNN